jgi:hypothetical protein
MAWRQTGCAEDYETITLGELLREQLVIISPSFKLGKGLLFEPV